MVVNICKIRCSGCTKKRYMQNINNLGLCSQCAKSNNNSTVIKKRKGWQK